MWTNYSFFLFTFPVSFHCAIERWYFKCGNPGWKSIPHIRVTIYMDSMEHDCLLGYFMCIMFFFATRLFCAAIDCNTSFNFIIWSLYPIATNLIFKWHFVFELFINWIYCRGGSKRVRTKINSNRLVFSLLASFSLQSPARITAAHRFVDRLTSIKEGHHRILAKN